MNPKLYKEFFRHLPVISAILDSEGNLVEVNKAFCRFFCSDKSNVIGEKFSLILSKNYSILNIDTKSTQQTKMWEIESKDGVTKQLAALQTLNLPGNENYTILFEVGTSGKTYTKKDVDELRKYLMNGSINENQTLPSAAI